MHARDRRRTGTEQTDGIIFFFLRGNMYIFAALMKKP